MDHRYHNFFQDLAWRDLFNKLEAQSAGEAGRPYHHHPLGAGSVISHDKTPMLPTSCGPGHTEHLGGGVS